MRVKHSAVLGFENVALLPRFKGIRMAEHLIFSRTLNHYIVLDFSIFIVLRMLDVFGDFLKSCLSGFLDIKSFRY